MSNILLAAESLLAKNSGIGRVARLMAKALREAMTDTGGKFTAVSLSDPAASVLQHDAVNACRGSRLRFVLGVQARGRRADGIFYDSLGMGRAHRLGPACRRPMLVWMHGVEVWENARADYLRVARRANLLITNSNYTRRRASNLHAGLQHAHVCWLGTETDELPPYREKIPNASPTALILSRIDVDSYKGHRELLDVWPTVQQRVPGARLVIAGAGSGLDDLRRTVQQSSVASFIDVVGYVSEDKLPQLWNHADVFAMPSRGEGFGLTYIEAMRHGVPVIASRQDAGQEVNLHGETGFNVDMDCPEDLADALIELLANHAQARLMGLAGRARWQRHFTWTAFRARFERALPRPIGAW